MLIKYAQAVKDLFEDTRAVAEPSGALSVAGMKNYIDEKISGKTLVAINWHGECKLRQVAAYIGKGKLLGSAGSFVCCYHTGKKGKFSPVL